MESHISTPANPYQPPRCSENSWRFDRSGVFQRVCEIVGLSVSSAIAGAFIGDVFVPNFTVQSGGSNLLIVLMPIAALTWWSVAKSRRMWKQVDNEPGIHADSGEHEDFTNSTNTRDDDPSHN